MTTRERSAVWLVMALLPLMMVGCQLGFGARPAATPIPPATPLPALPPSPSTPTPFEKTLQSTGMRSMEKEKVLDGNLHVRYLPPCERIPSSSRMGGADHIDGPAFRIISYILNRNGTRQNENPKPQYKIRAGEGYTRSRAEGQFRDGASRRPPCMSPNKCISQRIWQRDGWPDPHAEDIGDPPIPKVAMAIARKLLPRRRVRVCPFILGG